MRKFAECAFVAAAEIPSSQKAAAANFPLNR